MTPGWMPHGMCFLWTSWMITWQVAADLGIALAYFVIPVLLLQLIVVRWQLAGHPIVWWFIAFIALCGLTHLVAILTIWQPMYVAEAVLKTATAIVSLGTVVMLWRVLTRLVRTVDDALDAHDTHAIYELLARVRAKGVR